MLVTRIVYAPTSGNQTRDGGCTNIATAYSDEGDSLKAALNIRSYSFVPVPTVLSILCCSHHLLVAACTP